VGGSDYLKEGEEQCGGSGGEGSTVTFLPHASGIV